MKTDREKIESIKNILKMNEVSSEAKLLWVMLIVGDLNK